MFNFIRSLFKRAPAIGSLEAELEFRAAQKKVAEYFADPDKVSGSDEYHLLAADALHKWERWQGRPICSLEDSAPDYTQVEWDAVSLLNTL